MLARLEAAKKAGLEVEQYITQLLRFRGGKVTYATPGTGTSLHIGMEQIAAAMGEDDSPALHAADTVRAGDGLCDVAAVRVLVEEGRGQGGLIVVDWRGRMGWARSTVLMPVALTLLAWRPLGFWRTHSSSAAIVYERLRMFGATDSGTSAPPA